ncbi:UDP-N-acetylmuramoyl-L-alanyl-D-glutamate--2,6-diaminopimelate ligase, partial [Candidatus Daviesbacteria bacterium]|nr:UDP-N-acetylmuramoyl-L-alanyl-D-glutamate--2,6-diaminopimelate ligase [Candidatus Daviesbacteria bacterium]
MKEIIKRFLPQWVINYFWHLPKAILANIYYGFPTKKLRVIGVTGTDGKTTTVNMIYQILKKAGKKVSMISTLNAPGFHVTSPDPFVIQKFAKDLRNGYLVLEVTSHALDQFRFWGIQFEVGVITNITREHLDYHKTFENYKNIKLKLIENVKYAIVNSNLMTKSFRSKVICHGELITFGKDFKLKLKIPGDYNVENAQAALAVANILGIDPKITGKTLENFEGLTGRMEEVKNNRDIKIIIDFAHTPNALEQALKTLRQETKGKLIAVFGSAGKRDEGKRPLMGEIAGQLADYVIITAEDPRGELKSINEQIIAGIKNRKNLSVIDDRRKAISFAIN